MRNLSLAMLGFGNAGKAFAELLGQKHGEILEKYDCDIKIVAIATKSRGALENNQGINLGRAIKVMDSIGKFDPQDEDFSDIKSMEIAEKLDYDILIELTPLNIFSGQPAIDHIKAALCRGKHVITANKGPIAWAYSELRNLADENGSQFLFETTVMDGTPVFNLVDSTLPFAKVTEVKGILNSTTNYILEEMGKGKVYTDILNEGKRRGFVEADPSMDIEGWDAAAKTAALLNVLMGADITPNDIKRKGIEDITPQMIAEAEARGNVIKLLCSGSIKAGKVAGEVGPAEIPKSDFMAGISGTSSLISITTDLMKTISIVEHEPEIEQTAYGPFTDLIKIVSSLSR